MEEHTITKLPGYDAATLDREFGRLQRQVEEEAVMLETDEGREAFRLHWLGRKQGKLKAVSDVWLKGAPADRKGAVGQRFNELRSRIELLLETRRALKQVMKVVEPVTRGFSSDQTETLEKGLLADVAPRIALDRIALERRRKAARADPIDITLPGSVRVPGNEHPLLKTMNEVVAVFHRLGYSTALGPQVESDFYNFEALNFPPNHPARDTQDTLVLAGQQSKPSRDRLLMRTHTSPVQIRTMIAEAPPIRIVVPGKVHRNDAADATHSPVFHQVEGLCVDTNITFSDLKGTLDHAMKALFGSSVNTRFFPSFFPFTEPSADVQISCIFCAGKGCRKCKSSGWIELLGCGMVDPAVFASVDRQRVAQGKQPAYDSAKISGFAFGMGVERIAMIQHGISDIGQFYSGDMRFLEQFA
jgi:phenylalanyl-tRNA synthetase alpha chain